jgi:hypothetical protein
MPNTWKRSAIRRSDGRRAWGCGLDFSRMLKKHDNAEPAKTAEPFS